MRVPNSDKEAQAMAKIINGLDAEGIQSMVEMVTKQPEVAKATFYADTTWRAGFHNEAAVKAFSLGGARNDTTRREPFRVAGDHPPELLGTDMGPTSVELLLAALGHCLASGWATYGVAMGVSIE